MLDVKSTAFTSREIQLREDGLILYWPQNTNNRNEKPTFEIVLHRPTTETLVQTFRWVPPEDTMLALRLTGFS